MFSAFANQVWTGSSVAVVPTVNTDFSIDGSSYKIVWTAGTSETCTISFDSIDLSDYEEITFYLSQSSLIAPSDLFSITVDGVAYTFENLIHKWNHVLIDCTDIGATTEIVITSLVEDLTLFIDCLGYRKVDYTNDIDLLQAIQDTISLTYDVATTLSANVAAGASSIALTSTAYVTNTSALELDNGAGTTETVYLVDRQGTLKSNTTNAFTAGDTVNVLCPVLLDDYVEVEPDPVCGITVYDVLITNKRTGSNVITEYFENGKAEKVYTGALGVCIYIDCSSKKKVLQMSREFDFKYGKCFRILLDGEQVTVWLEDFRFVDDLIGNNPRAAYYYEIEPQPLTLVRAVPIDTFTLTVEIEPGSSVIP